MVSRNWSMERPQKLSPFGTRFAGCPLLALRLPPLGPLAISPRVPESGSKKKKKKGQISYSLLNFDPSPENFVNNNTVQAVSGGIVQLTGSSGGIFENQDNLIQAIGAGSEIRLTSNASIIGGTLHTKGGALIRGIQNQSFSFTDVTFDEGTE